MSIAVPEQEPQESTALSPVQRLTAGLRSDQFRPQIEAALTGTDLAPEKFIRAAVTALVEQPALADANRDSLILSVIRCAQDGLLPDGREAALVIYKTKDKTTEQWVQTVQYQPMIGGFRKIAGEHGWNIRSAVVYANDEFEYDLGLDLRLTHRPVRPGAERGPLVAAYAIAVHRDGRKELEVFTADDIAKIRATSKSKYGPWVDWEERMWEKSPARRLFLKLSLGEREDARVNRMLEALDQPDPAAALYGPAATSVSEAVAAAPPSPALQAAEETSPGSQAAPAQQAGPDVDPSASGPAPGLFDDDPEPERAQFVPPAGVLGSGTFFPRGGREGRSLAEVLAEGESGTKYLAWALRHPDHFGSGDFVGALHEFVQTALPDTYREATQQ